MRQLSSAGLQAVGDVAQRHGFSQDAVTHMLYAVQQGNGTMAQFNHQEFAGSGQWMSGGMIMLSDMFNNYLKGRVDTLCCELSNLLANRGDLFEALPPPVYSGSGQGGYYYDWWGADLGSVTASGSQNNSRYAYFAGSHRLAIEVNGTVTIYDTLDHQIGGVGQQQSYGGAMTFTSQYGTVDVTSLPVVSINGQAPQPVYNNQPVYAPPVYSQPPVSQPAYAPAPAPSAGEGDVFAAIEKLAALHAKGILSEQEFTAKKAELLSRL